jgi:hypothetical protein
MSSSLVERFNNEPFIEVTTKTLDTLMKDLGLDQIDLLKFDVEGAEYVALKDFKNILRVREVVGEIHLDLMAGVSRESFLKIFSNFDFSCYDISPKRFILRGSLKEKNEN